jgi:thiol-disulfide isomerase/thioredoxin
MNALLLLVLTQLPTVSLPATDGATHALAAEVARHDLTAVLFFSRECPVQRSHDARLLELVHDFAPKGVAFVAVDAQADASLEKDTEAVRARGYPFPVVIDAEGTWSDALGVRFSTTLVVLDSKGRVRYRGGLDDERVKVSNDATPLARRALERLVAGQEPERVETKALGCVLRRR